MKKVGIILRDFEENNTKYMGGRLDLFEALEPFNCLIIGIPITLKFNKLIKVVQECDGIILSGGNKFLENDFKLVDYLYKNDVPTLGICLGMQAMGEFFNGYKEKIVDKHYMVNHTVKITKDSLLYKILEQDEIMVNSRHRSALDGSKLEVGALANGVIEAIEDNNKRFFLGVQWHPESIKGNDSYLLFKYFINSLK